MVDVKCRGTISASGARLSAGCSSINGSFPRWNNSNEVEINLFHIALIPTVLVFITVGTLFSVISIRNVYLRHKKRRSPSTNKFLRGPGQSLIEKLDDINEELFVYLAMMIAMPLALYALYISGLYFQKRPLTLSSALTYIISGALFLAYMVFKMVRFLNLRRSTRLNYEGEVAAGQELNQMMLRGYHVYHDFVADKFNIDYIVVGPAGVFAVETKARAKPTSDDRTADAKVTYDGRCIHFPQWKENKPLEQAKAQAFWLERWLSSATGEKTVVRPVVALPGWYITRTASEGILVINPKQFLSVAKPINGNTLDERRIKSIVHQIDQRCRNIESKAVEDLGGRG